MRPGFIPVPTPWGVRGAVGGGVLRGVLGGVLWALLGAALFSPPLQGQTTAPPDTIQVDSTRLSIMEQLKGLARAPGVDSTWFVPDSLLSDSAQADREARLAGRRTRPPAASSAVAGDSTMAALMELKDYSLTTYESQGADFGARTKQLVLTGTPESRARLVRDGEEITADSALIYSDEDGKVYSVGADAIYQPKEGDPVNSRTIVFDLDASRGTAMDARTRFSAGADWIMSSEYLTVDNDAAYGHRVIFTTCEEEEPHYHFAAEDIKIINDNIMVARPVRLYFADVPVAWLPFMASSTDTRRASGILTPIFSVNDIVRTSQSYSRRISNLGLYWAINDYMDAQLAMDWWSGEHTALTGSYNFSWARQFLNGSMNYRQFWRTEGGKERAFDLGGNWEPDERTSLRFRARYASSSDFVRRTSFDPQEVVQSIDSEGGISRRFSFGNLSLSGNRRQYLSDDRVEMTLPTANFSLSPVTFLKASPSQARFYNNVTWSGSANYRRSISDRLPQSDSAFTMSGADKITTNAGMSTSLNLGNFSLASGVTIQQDLVQGVPLEVDSTTWEAGGYQDQAETPVTWNASLGYQQKLVGSTTITPSLRLSGNMIRSDTVPLAQDFVSAPTRLSLAVAVKTDFYGFFPGVGPFDAVRHKITPGFDFDYAPEVSFTELQSSVFGDRAVGRQKTLRLSLNQTFEAKLKDEAAAERAQEMDSLRVDSLTFVADSLRDLVRRLPEVAGDTERPRLDSLILVVDSLLADTTFEPESQREATKVTLLSLMTTAMTYDFEKASEDGEWLQGFTTTRLSNNIGSDYLRGLNLAVTHELFDENPVGSGEGESGPTRKFDPHLSSMNLGFSLSSQSWVFQTLGGLFRKEEEPGADSVVDAAEDEEMEGAFGTNPMDAGRIVPGSDPSPMGSPRRGGAGQVGQWRANLSYALTRPREETGRGNQMIASTVNFTPTEKWEVSWRTTYDVEGGSFNDHLIRLTRDLHRWEAYFDFRQTATGNWSFRFEVALMDQEDLKFDYQQRSIQERSGSGRDPGGFR